MKNCPNPVSIECNQEEADITLYNLELDITDLNKTFFECVNINLASGSKCFQRFVCKKNEMESKR